MAKVLDKERNIVPNWRKDSHSVRKYQFIYHFLPHPDKKTRASLLSVKAFVLYCFVIIAASGLFKILPLVAPDILGYASNINTYDLLSETNKKRSVLGLKPLTINKALIEASAKKAEHMFANNYWAHIAPDGTEPWDFILGEDYDYVYAGENLAKNFSNSDDVVDAWYNSPSHKENLLNPNYTEVGFAVIDGSLGGYETTLVVQMFGKPRLPSQMASADAEGISTKTTNVVNEPVKVPVSEKAMVKMAESARPLFDVRSTSRVLVLGLGALVISLFMADVWYSNRHHIPKFNGHTLAHISFLLIALLGIWFVLKPGVVL